ncbi:NAD(P)H-hydrate dehydratase [Flavobacterium agrisoli]|uniref:ADP-dependent (S)-NAD(P)H-hydrate dehydratase n=1 Tax=Flavobacterium agrisoli TaxID=2793066 RepID=A0A934UK60_9FLAO|nr:NAD(P)H-hydrate dehydratase [Flavobacterium agrisoli]MBK0370125.1 NAD(P)H-hydrate dehydratase [Flavobacterium agrisoli]
MKTAVLLDKKEILRFYKKTNPQTHKGLQGHALVIAGSYGKMGAAVLASKAALKSGCGLVTAFVPQCGYTILQIANPEVMTITDEAEKEITKISTHNKYQAIGLGPGIGLANITQNAVLDFLKNNRIPLVIDADAITILPQNQDRLSFLQPKTIFTPHPKELERLIGKWESDEDKFQKTILFSKKFDVVMVMKGAPTFIIYQDEIYKNTSGNAALATAGSGDTLTGIITGLLAQGYSPLEAAQMGVFLHGLTADLAISDIGTHAFIASDCIAYLGKAFLFLEAE